MNNLQSLRSSSVTAKLLPSMPSHEIELSFAGIFSPQWALRFPLLLAMLIY